MPVKLDEIYEAEVESLENEGNGVCKVNGFIIFVPKVLKGEKIRFRITEIKKNFARGKLINIITPSKNRVESKCPYYEECGGCNLRHQNSKENLKFKQEKVKNAITKIGKINVKIEEIIPSFKENNYRNKANFKVENDRIGFYQEGTYQLADIENCMLLENEINNALLVIRDYIKVSANDIKTITVKYGNALDDILIDIYSTDKNDIKICNYLIENIKKLKTLIFNNEIIYGDGYIKQIINDLMFNCSSKSFFQVNSMQTEKLYKTAIKEANINENDVVLDLYCGTGTITNLVAQHAKKVIGIEIVEDAVKDAIKNSEINNIKNTTFICGDANKKIELIKEKLNVIIVDPPRSGVDKKAINIMKKINPEKIVYISCNPVTLARDLNLLNDLYKIKKVIPVDMFPNTSHVETVCILERK